jgi:hypothetical protein
MRARLFVAFLRAFESSRLGCHGTAKTQKHEQHMDKEMAQ